MAVSHPKDDRFLLSVSSFPPGAGIIIKLSKDRWSCRVCVPRGAHAGRTTGAFALSFPEMIRCAEGSFPRAGLKILRAFSYKAVAADITDVRRFAQGSLFRIRSLLSQAAMIDTTSGLSRFSASPAGEAGALLRMSRGRFLRSSQPVGYSLFFSRSLISG